VEIEFKSILEQVIDLARETGIFIRKEGANFNREKIEYKGFNDLVSYVDKEAERKLVSGLIEVLPDAGFIAEEGSESIRQGSFTWIVDPLDGTTNFTHGLPVFAISIALMKMDKIVLGVVYEVNRDEYFYSRVGDQAYCNDQVISISPEKELSGSLLATGFPYHDFEKMPNYLQVLNGFMQKTHGLRRMGSAAVDLAYVACGRFEGFFEYNLNAWDIAAGAFIVEQAGGHVSDFSGGPNYLFGKEIIAAGYTHSQMQKEIAKYWN